MSTSDYAFVFWSREQMPTCDLSRWMEALERRLARLDGLVTLFLAPVNDCNLELSAFQGYLMAHEGAWAVNGRAGWRHLTSGVQLTLPDAGDYELKLNLREVLLAISVAEGRTPAAMLTRIQPDAFPSVVDALGSIPD